MTKNKKQKFWKGLKFAAKSSLKLITVCFSQSTLLRISSSIAIWAVESLVRNSKSKVDDKVLDIIKKELNK